MSKGDDQVWIAQNLGRSTGAQGMSTIDKIMGAVGRHGDDCIRDADAASESFEALRELIAAALADARRDVAEQMREAADQLRADADEIFPPSDRGRQAPVEVRQPVDLPTFGLQTLGAREHFTRSRQHAGLNRSTCHEPWKDATTTADPLPHFGLSAQPVARVDPPPQC